MAIFTNNMNSRCIEEQSQLTDGSSSEENAQDNKDEETCYSNNRESSGVPNGFFASTVPSFEWNKLNLWVEEPEPWCDTIGKEAKLALPAKEIKRQNTIHDLYITEKHHCQTLVVLKHTYFDSLALNCIVSVEELHKLMPNLNDLLLVHCNFLRMLKECKENSTVVGAVHQILLSQFTGEMAARMIRAYTSFCSQKDAAVRMYNIMYKESNEFRNLIYNINSTGFYKTWSLTDCLLRVTQRLSKYHQFVESLVKNTQRDSDLYEGMLEAEKAVKNLIMAVDEGIDKIQMQEMRQNIACNLDPNASAEFGDSRFTTEDFLSEERTLLHIVEVQWYNAKRNVADVLLLLFTDIVIFLQKSNSNVYNLYSQDGKSSIASLKKMIVRDKAGKFGSDGVYLIATFPKPEMYEVKCRTKKDSAILINRVQQAVEQFTASGANKAEDEKNYSTLEELRRLHASLEAKKREFTQLVEETQFNLSRREKLIAEREAKLDREDGELRARWMHLYRVWEQQRLNGLPVDPLTPPYCSSSNGVAPRGAEAGSPLMSPSADFATVVEPSICQRRQSSSAHHHRHSSSRVVESVRGAEGGGGGGGGKSFPASNLYRSASSSAVPPVLRGSLVHRGCFPASTSAADHQKHGAGRWGHCVESAPKMVLPVKLSTSRGASETSLSARLNSITRSKKSNSLLPLLKSS